MSRDLLELKQSLENARRQAKRFEESLHYRQLRLQEELFQQKKKHSVLDRREELFEKREKKLQEQERLLEERVHEFHKHKREALDGIVKRGQLYEQEREVLHEMPPFKKVKREPSEQCVSHVCPLVAAESPWTGRCDICSITCKSVQAYKQHMKIHQRHAEIAENDRQQVLTKRVKDIAISESWCMRTDMYKKFVYWIQEREQVRLKKESGACWPWSSDPILNSYKFCNISRRLDSTSQWLYSEWIGKHAKAEDPGVLIYNIVLFRAFGTVRMASMLGWQLNYDMEGIVKAANACKQNAFTEAYCCIRHSLERKSVEAANRAYKDICENQLRIVWNMRHILANACESSKCLYDCLRRIPGFRRGCGFMAQEVVQDILQTDLAKNMTDKNLWCVVGPGARRGMNRLCGRDHQWRVACSSLPWDKACKHLFHQLRVDNMHFCQQCNLCLHDVQFCLCEFDKYMRIYLNQKGKRRFYEHVVRGDALATVQSLQ